MGLHDLADEPREPGAVIRVHNPDAKYPEIWVASHINGGAWYPDQETYLTGIGVRAFLKEHNEYPDYWHVAQRGRLELLTVGDRGAYREGWRAGVRHVVQIAEESETDYPDDEAMAAIAAACTCPGCMTGGKCIDDDQSDDDEGACRVCLYDFCRCPEEEVGR